MSEKSKSTTHAGVLGDMARSPGKLATRTSSGCAWHLDHAHVPMRLCRTRGPLDEAGSLSLRCSRFHVDTPTFQYSRIGDDGSRSDRGDEPLERTAARSILKPCLEAGHRIVPTCQPVHVDSDRTDRSSVLLLDCTPSDDQFPAGGFNPGRSSNSACHGRSGPVRKISPASRAVFLCRSSRQSAARDKRPRQHGLLSQPDITWASFSGLAWLAVCEAF